MTLGPYLFFEGNCREAMQFYEQCFGGELYVMTFKDAQREKCPVGLENEVMHAALTRGGFTLLASDTPPGMTAPSKGTNVGLVVNCESDRHVDELFEKLSAGGNPEYPPHEAFWGARFASFKDRYGFGWMLSFERPKSN